jgi:hypothetical protein
MAILKNKIQRCALLLIVSLFSLSCQASDTVVINSLLEACITISKTKIQKVDNLLLLKTTWNLKDNIGNCGCKSAAMSYSVYRLKSEKLMSHGIISTFNKMQATFVLSSDNTIYKNTHYKLAINCAN